MKSCWWSSCAGVLLCAKVGASPANGSPSTPARSAVYTVTVEADRPLNRFRPDEALGAGVDGHEEGDAQRLYSPGNLRAMKSAGLQSLTYRLRTELSIEAWHWNPVGAWSEGVHGQGYWTSADASSRPIEACYGYRLPRRGTTTDEADNDGYSRLDDGKAATFWKSNPYLDCHFTGEANTKHPQWIVIDLGRSQPIDMARLRWGLPYAISYTVAYWDGTDDMGDSDEGHWRAFPGGVVRDGRGGDVRLRLAPQPLTARFLRVTMTESCERGAQGARDVRDRLGYALREVGFGVMAHGRFQDAVKHAPNHAQTPVYASSCDPWHRAVDRDPHVEQPSFDRVMSSGLTRSLPVLLPVGVLYDTPDNAAAELRFLLHRGVPVAGVELGEEPDGQFVAPDDYAALCVQFARALHQVRPSLKLGGPSFQSVRVDVLNWPLETRPKTWLAEVLDYLAAHGCRQDFSFCSFEWYPFDDVCSPTMPHLLENPAIVRESMERLRHSGMHPDEPIYMTEYGYSAFSGQPEVEIAGALLDADSVGEFLACGGARAYFYGYEPQTLIEETHCPARGWGNDMMLLGNDDGQAQSRVAAFYAMWLLTHRWTEPGNGLHTLCETHSDAPNGVITSYALHRPDGTWSLLLVNKDERVSHRVHIGFARLGGTSSGHTATASFNGALTEDQYSAQQYVWKANGEHGRPVRDLPPMHRMLSSADSVELPPYSLTVLQGRAGRFTEILSAPKGANTG